MKLASIIVRTKNEGKWIRRCLEAIYDQTYTNVEVVVVDSGSTDNTLSILDEFADQRLILVHYEGDYIPGKSLNFGCQNANGEYFVFLSAHCIPASKTWLENLLIGLNESPRVYRRLFFLSHAALHDSV